MKLSPATFILLLAPWVPASPLLPRASTSALSTLTPTPSAPAYDFTHDAVLSYPIHASCNSTLRHQLSLALNETIQLALHAKQHLLLRGHDSPFIKAYFGNSSTSQAIGWYDRIASANKIDMLFRCDDPDRNCETQSGWAGHHRGANGTQETVICPLSFSTRRWLAEVCGLGYTVAKSPLNTYWATDLMHRILHVPRISEGVVGHFADGHEGVLELAKREPQRSVVDSEALQYFAVGVWAWDRGAPGVGCWGWDVQVGSGTVEGGPTGTETVETSPTGTASAKAGCHTHGDGVVHCA